MGYFRMTYFFKKNCKILKFCLKNLLSEKHWQKMYKMLFLDVCDVFVHFGFFCFVTSNVYFSFLFKELNLPCFHLTRF